MINFSPPIESECYDILNSEGVLAVVGTGRSGKTALAHLLASWSSKPVYCVEYPSSLIESHCPPDWNTISSDDIFNLQDCVLLVDDAALIMSSRDYSNEFSKKFIRFQTIISHKGITLVFIIQNLQLLDIGTLRSQRMCVLYKHSNLNNIMFERDEYKSIALTAITSINRCREEYPDMHPKSFVYDDSMGKVWSHPIAPHWTPELSIPYRDYFL